MISGDISSSEGNSCFLSHSECLLNFSEELFTLNFAISNSEVTKVTLKKRRFGEELTITTNKKKYEWSDKIYEEHKWKIAGLLPKKKGVKLEDYENVLRPIFGDKLSVKK